MRDVGVWETCVTWVLSPGALSHHHRPHSVRPSHMLLRTALLSELLLRSLSLMPILHSPPCKEQPHLHAPRPELSCAVASPSLASLGVTQLGAVIARRDSAMGRSSPWSRVKSWACLRGSFCEVSVSACLP